MPLLYVQTWFLIQKRDMKWESNRNRPVNTWSNKQSEKSKQNNQLKQVFWFNIAGNFESERVIQKKWKSWESWNWLNESCSDTNRCVLESSIEYKNQSYKLERTHRVNNIGLAQLCL